MRFADNVLLLQPHDKRLIAIELCRETSCYMQITNHSLKVAETVIDSTQTSLASVCTGSYPYFIVDIDIDCWFGDTAHPTAWVRSYDKYLHNPAWVCFEAGCLMIPCSISPQSIYGAVVSKL